MKNNASLLEQFQQEGYCELPQLNGNAANALLRSIQATRPFDERLFFTHEQWEASPKSHKHTNPLPGRNLLESLQPQLEFVEKNAQLQSLLTTVLGKNFRWWRKKLVCRLPMQMLPAWLRASIEGKPANTLGAFVPEQWRDITYIVVNDLHQDIIDWVRMPVPEREHRIISLYVYLDDVTEEDAPVALLPGTHRFGATAFQHDVRHLGNNIWHYGDGRGHSIHTEMREMTGKAGWAGLWHSCLVHSARPVYCKPRISLLYFLARSLDDDSPCLLDHINAQLQGPLYLEADYTPGAHAQANGTWQLLANDFTALPASYGEKQA